MLQLLHCKIILLWIITSAVCGTQYNKYIKHFEPLTYNSTDIQYHHLQQLNPFVDIKFLAHGRRFHLKLVRDTSTFAKDMQVDSPAGILQQFDTSHIYEGTLWGEANTKVFGSIQNGVFDGTIHTEQGAYYIERTNKHFANEISLGFHSLIYHERDITDHHQGFGGCGATDAVSEWMHKISHSAIEEFDILDEEHSIDRAKRAVLKKQACSLYIQTDTFLWDHIYNQEKDAVKTRQEITALIAQHVKAVNHIYRNTSFNSYQDIKFVVQRITLNDSTTCRAGASKNPFCADNIDVGNFLNLHSHTRYDQYCLAYVFTYRDFSGTLGLAWVASPQGPPGGICEQNKYYKNIVDGSKTKLSLNTGIITLNNYNTTVPPKISHLMFAHEIGHNFGSPHDYPDECKPGGIDGNYIMFAGSTSGDRRNNDRFSPCSVGNISAVLHALFSSESSKHQCLTEATAAFCGNKITEDNEQCDCGYNEDECKDQCCFPRNSIKQCTLRPSAECSPSQGPCCNTSCRFEDAGKFCRLESECKFESACDGSSAMCPPSPLQPNYTECNEETRVCLDGECVGSICLPDDMEECFINNSSTPEKLCEQACQANGGRVQWTSKQDSCVFGPCSPSCCSGRWLDHSQYHGQSQYAPVVMSMRQPLTCRSHVDDDNNYIKLRPGTPCNEFKGYCDSSHVCRPVHVEDPLNRIKNMTFDQNNVGTAVAVCGALLIGTLLSILDTF